MWCGTPNGLFRFDGYEYKKYFDSDYDTSSRYGYHNFQYLEDSKGQLWICTRRGLGKYVEDQDKFILYPYKDLNKNPVEGPYKIKIDKYDRIWACNYYLSMFDPRTEKITYFLPDKNNPKAAPDINIHDLIIDNYSNVWLTTNGHGIFRFNPTKGEWKQYLFGGTNYFPQITIDKEGIIWTYETSSKLLRIDPNNGDFEWIPTPISLNDRHFIFSIIADSLNNIWIAPVGVPHYYNSKKKTWGTLKVTFKNTSEDNPVFTFFYYHRDRTLFISVLEDGIKMYPIDSWAQRVYPIEVLQPQENPGLTKKLVDTLNKDEDMLLIEGVFYDLNKLEFIGVDENHKKIIKLQDGKYYFADDLKKSIPFMMEYEGILKNTFISINKDRWGSSGKKIIRKISGSNEIKVYSVDSIRNHDYKLVEDYNGNIYCYDAQAIYYLNQNKDIFEKITINDYHISYAAADASGNLWITTYSNIYKFNIKSKSLINISNNRSQFNFSKNKFVIDKSENLWLINYDKLYKYDVQKDLLTSFYLSGFGPAIPHRLTSYKGKIYYSFVKYVLEIDPEQQIFSINKEKPVITEFTIFNKPVKPSTGGSLEENIINAKEITLTHKQSTFGFKFSSLDYFSPENILFRYRLLGYDTNWTITQHTNRNATYTNLDPGEYIFQVMAQNPDGTWNHETRSITVIIIPPWWGTWWFKSFILFVIVLSPFIIYNVKNHYTLKRNRWLKQEVALQTREIEKKNIALSIKNEEIERSALLLNEINQQLKNKNAELEKAGEELKKQSEELYESNSLLSVLNTTKDKLFSIIAHDLKNPFQAIMGLTDLLINNQIKFEEDEKEEMIREVHGSTKAAYNLLENLLLWARSQTGSINVKSENFLINQLMEEAININRIAAINKGIEIVLKTSGNRSVFADQNMVRTILINFINNAIKFTRENGKVSVSNFLKNNNIIIEVSDTGVGLSEEKINQLFKVGNRSTIGTKGEKGTGLGLIIAKEFALKNNGDIQVESIPNKGSIFRLVLPAAMDDQQDKDYLEPEKEISINHFNYIKKEPVKHSGNTKSILIVDDSEAIRIYINNVLKNNYKCSLATNGEEGYQMAVETLPDLIISDIIMPGMDGFQLCEQLKQNWATSHIPVILLTSETEDETRIKGFKYGADEYISKPFQKELLLTRISNLIQGRALLQEKYTKNILSKEAPEEISNRRDQEFLEKIIKEIENNISDPDFGVDQLASIVNMSRVQLYRKLDVLTGQGVSDFIKTIRLKRAAQLLLSGEVNVNEAVYATGFKEKATFTRSFTKLFGVTPGKFKPKTE